MSAAPLVVTFGEAMLRLTPPPGERLAGSRQLSMHVGGAEANVAAGIKSLGMRSRWFSRVSTLSTGDAVLREIAAHGVDTAHVLRANGRTGLYFLEEGDGPRPASVTYDRAGSAFTGIGERDAAAALDAGLLEGAAAFVTSGITLALGDGPSAAARRIWNAAHAQLRCFDVNYRASLATPEEAAAAAEPYMASCDVLFVAERDAITLFGKTDLRSLVGDALVVMTRGSEGAVAQPAEGAAVSARALPVGDSGRIGRGDAFVAGFVTGMLRGLATVEALRLGVASASYKSSLAGDLARLDGDAVEALAAGDSGGDVLR